MNEKVIDGGMKKRKKRKSKYEIWKTRIERRKWKENIKINKRDARGWTSKVLKYDESRLKKKFNKEWRQVQICKQF